MFFEWIWLTTMGAFLIGGVFTFVSWLIRLADRVSALERRIN